MRRFSYPMTLLLFLASVMAGCSSRDPNLPELFDANGTIKLNGQPLANAVISFRPIGTTRGNGAIGQTDAEGRYTLTSRHLGKGVPAGEYCVTIEKMVASDGSELHDLDNFDPQSTPCKSLLPPYYSKPGLSKLTATVSKENTENNFDLSL